MTIEDLVSLIPVLAAAYGVVLGGAALATGWQLFSEQRRRAPTRQRRGAVVPPLGEIRGNIGRGVGIGGESG